MKAYPTRNGIAVPIFELDLPESELDLTVFENRNNHHNEWSRRDMGRHAITQALRDLERHQFVMGIDVHTFLHQKNGPPNLPTLEQAAGEVIDAFEKGEQFKCYDATSESYYLEPIPSEFVNMLVRMYGASIFTFR